MKTNKKVLEGVVVSNKMDKTISVEIKELKSHPLLGKPVKKRSIIKAHDEKNECKIGDRVRIVEFRPISKTKSWRLIGIIERAISEEA